MNVSGKTLLFLVGAIVIGGILASLSTRLINDKISEAKLAKAANAEAA